MALQVIYFDQEAKKLGKNVLKIDTQFEKEDDQGVKNQFLFDTEGAKAIHVVERCKSIELYYLYLYDFLDIKDHQIFFDTTNQSPEITLDYEDQELYDNQVKFDFDYHEKDVTTLLIVNYHREPTNSDYYIHQNVQKSTVDIIRTSKAKIRHSKRIEIDFSSSPNVDHPAFLSREKIYFFGAIINSEMKVFEYDFNGNLTQTYILSPCQSFQVLRPLSKTSLHVYIHYNNVISEISSNCQMANAMLSPV